MKELDNNLEEYKSIGLLPDDDMDYITEASMLCNTHACLLLQGGLLEDANSLLKRAVSLTSLIVQSNPKSFFSLQARSSALYNMGKYEEILHHLPQCLTYYMRCLESDEVIFELSKYSSVNERGSVDNCTLASDYLNIARILNELNKPILTKEYLNSAIQNLNCSLELSNRDKPAVKRIYVSALYNLGIIEEKLENFKNAENAFNKGFKICEEEWGESEEITNILMKKLKEIKYKNDRINEENRIKKQEKKERELMMLEKSTFFNVIYNFIEMGNSPYRPSPPKGKSKRTVRSNNIRQIYPNPNYY